jgi:hypothetical protein
MRRPPFVWRQLPADTEDSLTAPGRRVRGATRGLRISRRPSKVAKRVLHRRSPLAGALHLYGGNGAVWRPGPVRQSGVTVLAMSRPPFVERLP